ncbi:MAG: enoyl-CoA hydratase [Alphaproteobacteria bacterium]|nr:enoyl-CoA hydratase [Alphaproteobacteria bacterium]
MTAPVTLDVKNATGWITLNRPQVLNALNEELAEALIDVSGRVERDPAIRCVVVQGAGDHFCAGGDITMFRALAGLSGDERYRKERRLLQVIHIAILSLAQMPKPVIAKVQGAAAGIGLSLVLLSDLAVAADDAKFTLAYNQIGLSPDGSSSFFLPRIVGLKKAMEIAFLGERLDAPTAQSLGIVNRVVSRADLDRTVADLAGRLASGATQAFARTKQLMQRSAYSTFADQLSAEVEHFAESAATADFVEGVTAFLEKRPAKFQGR